MADAGGACRSAGVEFGTNAASGCRLEVSADSARNCSGLRARLLRLHAELGLWNLNLTHAGLYGDSHVTDPADWLEIEYVPADTSSSSSSSSSSSNGSCPQLPVAVTLTVLTTPQGRPNNPQWRIVGAQVRVQSADWVLPTHFPASIDLQNTVAFVPVHQDVLAGRRRAAPATGAVCRHSICAGEWFYPLNDVYTDAAAANPEWRNQLAAAYGLLLLLIFLPLLWCQFARPRRSASMLYS